MIDVKDFVSRSWANAMGWRTPRKILVLESDDWGAIRTRDEKVLRALKTGPNSIPVSHFDTLDCLESKTDFEALLNVLMRFRDCIGNPAKMTLNTVMGNPDFDAIRKNHFERFEYEHFFRSYDRYYGEGSAKNLVIGD